MKNKDTTCVVAVLDTGINASELKAGSYFPELSFNPEAEIPPELRVHGTAVCNTILSIAPDARILPIQITNKYGQLNTALLEAALEWILMKHQQKGIKIICAAFADYTNQLSDEQYVNSKIFGQITALKEQGVVMVAAAGNWQQEFEEQSKQGMAWPAIIRDVISVGALSEDEQIANYSQRLNEALNTTSATAVFTHPAAPGDTSGATAVVAGLLAKYYIEQPQLSISNLMDRLHIDLQRIQDKEGNLWPALIYRP